MSDVLLHCVADRVLEKTAKRRRKRYDTGGGGVVRHASRGAFVRRATWRLRYRSVDGVMA